MADSAAPGSGNDNAAPDDWRNLIPAGGSGDTGEAAGSDGAAAWSETSKDVVPGGAWRDAVTAEDAELDGITTVATGLNNPRGLTIGPDGALYVTEAGLGDPSQIRNPNPTGTCFTIPEAGAACFGETGSVTRVFQGQQERVLEGVPSVSATRDLAAVGLSDVTFTNGQMYLSLGVDGPADPAAAPPELDEMGKVLRANLEQGDWEVVADISAYEEANDPDDPLEDGVDELPDSNANSLVGLQVGSHYVVDAGGNTLLYVSRNGDITTRFVFPKIEDVTVPPDVCGNTEEEVRDIDAVPTSVVRGPDGAFYVSELTGCPFPVGGARVWQLAYGEEPEVFATGFTTITDLAFDSQGRLLVTEIAEGGLAQFPLPPGRLIRVNDDGSQENLTPNGELQAPGGVTVINNVAYVSNNSIGVGPAGESIGSVVRVPLE